MLLAPSASLFALSLVLTLLLASSTLVTAQVLAQYPNGPENPPAPFLASPTARVNASSFSRLVTVNSIGPESVIGNVEPIVVAYCLQARNNARLIPDGTIYSAHFIRTPLYVQIQGFFDGTKINIPYGDTGGELDPHGAQNQGNPVGGNVTSNVSGEDVFYEEWMSFISFDQFCIRICIAETPTVPAALQCEHELDVMGCRFVMPGDYSNNSFTSCEGEAAAPPGLYLQPDGSTSTFRQGMPVTPAAAYATPATSNCVSTSSISNGLSLSTTSSARPTSSSSAPAKISSSTSNGDDASKPAAATSAPSSSTGVGSSGAGRRAGGVSERGGMWVTWGVGMVVFGGAGGVLLV
ncbi:hypothetical protein BDY24DRAFT_438827 [Mrakia frigida]|uniref:uncharacterized protein n=1 Tax=Mrakia frigida TaxID=29902 RepID=UPI003FCC0FFD